MNDLVLNLFEKISKWEKDMIDFLRISSANEWADKSFNDGISNKAGWKSKSYAVGRFNGSGSRHFKTRS